MVMTSHFSGRVKCTFSFIFLSSFTHSRKIKQTKNMNRSVLIP